MFPKRPDTFWSVKLPDGDAVECATQHFGAPFVRGRLVTFVRWRHGHDRKYIFLGASSDGFPIAPGNGSTFEMRSSNDGKRVWLVSVQVNHLNVRAAIDRQTGECRNSRGVVDANLSVTEQFRTRNRREALTPTGPPTWADPKGGKLLATLTEEQFDHNLRNSNPSRH